MAEEPGGDAQPGRLCDLEAEAPVEIVDPDVRLPLSLLESRHDPTFRASYPVALLPETPGDVVFVRIGSEESQVSLDSEGRIVQILWAGFAPFDSSKRASIRVTYSDSRTVKG
jgi:hypothetical protein